jgi:hypothetical protein
MILDTLQAAGFDTSRRMKGKVVRVGCSQCAAVVIMGTPTHETGCPNRTYKCKGCWNRVEYPGYCEDCR